MPGSGQLLGGRSTQSVYSFSILPAHECQFVDDDKHLAFRAQLHLSEFGQLPHYWHLAFGTQHTSANVTAAADIVSQHRFQDRKLVRAPRIEKSCRAVYMSACKMYMRQEKPGCQQKKPGCQYWCSAQERGKKHTSVSYSDVDRAAGVDGVIVHAVAALIRMHVPEHGSHFVNFKLKTSHASAENLDDQQSCVATMLLLRAQKKLPSASGLFASHNWQAERVKSRHMHGVKRLKIILLLRAQKTLSCACEALLNHKACNFGGPVR